jgi:flagellar M-ring protein FliF
MSATLGRAKGLLAGFTPGQRGVIVVATLGLLLGVFALSRWAAQPTWTPLYSGLSDKDTSKIVEELTTEGVKYQLSNGGKTILVPQSQVYDLRVALSGKDLPSSDSDGYSILDNQGMTATDLQQNTAVKRATEAELVKTLQAMDGIEAARVALAIPEKSVFTTEQDKTTASVTLMLGTGVDLSDEQVASITHIVSGAVAGLDPDSVNVTDTAGHLLSAPGMGVGGTGGRAASRNDEQTAMYEDRLSTSVQQMLDRVLGAGKAVVRVNAQLDYDTRDTTTEKFVQESPSLQPLSEATSREWYGDGVAGTGGNLGGAFPTLTPVPGATGSAQYVKENRTVDNAIGKIVERAQAAPGSVERLTVAVVLDQKAAGGVTPAQVQALVSNAVGLDPRRGDAVQVSALPFDQATAAAAAKELAAQQKAERTAGYIDLGKKAGIGLMVVIALFLLTRRGKSAPVVEAVATDLPDQGLLGGANAAGLPGGSMGAITASVEDDEEAAAEAAFDRDRMRDEVAALVDNQPDEMAAVIQGWLSERK